MKKKELRITAKEIRKSLDIATVSKNIVAKILELDIYKSAKNVMIFYPLKDEIDLLKLAEDNHKNFYLPRVNGEKLECCPLKGGLKQGRFGIMEPVSECVICPNLDIIFVPALAVDNEGNRLGYGGGFYDRFLKDIKTTKIVPISKSLVFDNIPTEDFDIKIDMIITD